MESVSIAPGPKQKELGLRNPLFQSTPQEQVRPQETHENYKVGGWRWLQRRRVRFVENLLKPRKCAHTCFKSVYAKRDLALFVLVRRHSRPSSGFC